MSRKSAFLLALTLSALTLWALAISHTRASCPAEAGPFSCVALVRPPLRSLGPIPLTPLIALGAATETLAVLLLLARGPRLPFARDVAILSAAGAGVALGLQPLALLVARRACLVCLLALVVQLALAAVLVKIARSAGAAKTRALVGAFLVAVVVTGGGASVRGAAQRHADDEASSALAAIERPDGRVVLVERPGCPYCEALRLDVLARPEVLARLTKTGLARREAVAAEPAPMLLARDRDGREVARELGFQPDASAYEAVLAAAER